jgi:uncharacterized protein YjbJ (UPF0337 family)
MQEFFMNKPALPPAAAGPAAGKADKRTHIETAQYLGNVTAQAPGADPVSDRWKRLVGSARIVWSRLGEEELLKSNGQAEVLTGLVQERYALSREAAGKKVRSFLTQYRL